MKIVNEIPVRQDIVVDVVESRLEVAYANQYDDNTSTIHCHIQNKGVDFNIENYTATLWVKKSNGRGFSANIGSKELEGSVQDNVVSFKIPRYLTVSHGKQICNLEFFEKDHVENGVKYSCTFYLRVNESALKEEDILDSDCYASVHDEYVKLKTDLTDALTKEQGRATQAENTISDNLVAHSADKENPHAVTKAQLGLGNVENKSSADIRDEITKTNVTDALGYTPINSNSIGTAGGVASLDDNGKIPTEQISNTIETEITESIEAKIAELKKSVSDGKSALASAITEMGVSTATDDTFDTIAENVKKIKPTINVGGSVSGSWGGATFYYGGSGGGSANINGKNSVSTSCTFSTNTTTVGGNALASDVLSGKTFSSNNAGRAVNGTMTNRGAYTYDMWTKHTSSGVDQNLKVTIPAGYHNGSGYVRFPENVQTHALRMHTFAGSNNYTYLTIAPENGYYYSFTASVNGITATQCVFIVCYNSHGCNSVLDIIPVLKSDGVTKYTSQSGDYRAWGNRNQYHIEKIASNKYASGQWMGVQILTMVAQA